MGFYAQSLEISQWVVLRLTGNTCLAVIAFTHYSGVNLGPKDRAKTQSDCLLMRKQCSVGFPTPQKGKAGNFEALGVQPQNPGVCGVSMVCNSSDIARPIGHAQEGYSSGAYDSSSIRRIRIRKFSELGGHRRIATRQLLDRHILRLIISKT